MIVTTQQIKKSVSKILDQGKKLGMMQLKKPLKVLISKGVQSTGKFAGISTTENTLSLIKRQKDTTKIARGE